MNLLTVLATSRPTILRVNANLVMKTSCRPIQEEIVSKLVSQLWGMEIAQNTT